MRRWLERRRVVLGTAALMFAGLFTGLQFIEDPAYGIGLLGVVPIILVALELGLAGGAAAATLAIAILVIGALGDHPDISAIGVATRGLVFVTTGMIAGRFSDRMRETERRGMQTLRSGLRLSELPDKEALPVLVAESAMRAVDADGAVVTLQGAGRASVGSATGRRVAVPVEGRGRMLGKIEVWRRGPLRPEDSATLRLLSLQAGLALDNVLLLERERERAAVEAELRAAQRRLTEQRSELGYLVRGHEQERGRIARKLHEELAQILAAVLWGLELAPAAKENGNGGALDELRGQVVTVLDDIRELAGSLRPSSLDQLGLESALGSLVRSQAEREVTLSVNAGPLPDTLPEAVRTGVYRIVEDALGLAELHGDAGCMRVELTQSNGMLAVALTLPLPRESLSSLAAIRGRVELLEGNLRVQELGPRLTRLVVKLPLVQSELSPEPSP